MDDVVFLRPSVAVTRIYVTKNIEWKKPEKEHCLLLHWHLDNEIKETSKNGHKIHL